MNTDPNVSIELPLSAWVAIADLLGRLAYNETVAYIAALGEQVVPHIQTAQAALQSQVAEVAAAAPEISQRMQ